MFVETLSESEALVAVGLPHPRKIDKLVQQGRGLQLASAAELIL